MSADKEHQPSAMERMAFQFVSKMVTKEHMDKFLAVVNDVQGVTDAMRRIEAKLDIVLAYMQKENENCPMKIPERIQVQM